jgi:hypothetical protein
MVMQCNEIEQVLVREGLAPLPEAARAHLAECSACRHFVADLTSIVSVAHELPAEVEPPARIWLSLQAQLVQEGIIKTPTVPMAQDRVPWWQPLLAFLRSRSLATATVGLLLVAAAIFQVRTNDTASTPVAPANHPSLTAFENTRITLNEQEPVARGMILASTSPTDNSLRQNLDTLDQFISDCEQRIKEEPQDELTREYLANAYEQKAELLSAMMDRGGSVN